MVPPVVSCCAVASQSTHASATDSARCSSMKTTSRWGTGCGAVSLRVCCTSAFQMLPVRAHALLLVVRDMATDLPSISCIL